MFLWISKLLGAGWLSLLVSQPVHWKGLESGCSLGAVVAPTRRRWFAGRAFYLLISSGELWSGSHSLGLFILPPLGPGSSCTLLFLGFHAQGFTLFKHFLSCSLRSVFALKGKQMNCDYYPRSWNYKFGPFICVDIRCLKDKTSDALSAFGNF